MDDDELQELQNPATWDFDQAEERAPVKRPRVVVSVAFQREDFDRVAALARRFNMRTSEYIREAALGRVRSRPVTAGFCASSTGGGVLQGDFTGAANATFNVEEQPAQAEKR